MNTTRPIQVRDQVHVGTHPEVGVVKSIAPAELGGELYAVIFWPEHRTHTSWLVSGLTLATEPTSIRSTLVREGDQPCTRCGGQGEYKLIGWHHCGDCYGSGIKGMNIGVLEQRRIERAAL